VNDGKLVGDRWPAMIRWSICCSSESSTRCKSITKLPTFPLYAHVYAEAIRELASELQCLGEEERNFQLELLHLGEEFLLHARVLAGEKSFLIRQTLSQQVLDSVSTPKRRRFNENT
jgi:hypothetical protein